MLLFLSGERSDEYATNLADYWDVTIPNRQVYALDYNEEKADRLAYSFLNAVMSNITSDTGEEDPIIIFSAPGLWFLDDREGFDLEIMFETLGGVLLTDNRYSYKEISEREKYPSYQKESYLELPSITENLQETSRIILSHLEYGESRGKSIAEVSHKGFYGEVLGSPRTIFVSENPHDDGDLINDLNFVCQLKKHLIPSHRNHIGVVALDSVTDMQEAAPFSAYVAIGSSAYKFIDKYMDADIVKAGIPNHRGIKNWDNPEDIFKKFARLTSNVVESGERKTSLLHL